MMRWLIALLLLLPLAAQAQQVGANKVYSGPTNGGAASPSFRALVPLDMAAILSNANSWSAAQTFANSDILLSGSSSGATTFTSANAGATNYTLTIPANTGTLGELNLAQTWTATQTFNPPSGTFNQAIATTQTGPSSGSTSGPTPYNLLNVTHSSTVTGASLDSFGLIMSHADGFRVQMTVSGAATGGPFVPGVFAANVTATGSQTETIGLLGSAYANVTTGITSELAGLYGFGHLGPSGSIGGSSVLVGVGAEVMIESGGSAPNRFGLWVRNIGAVAGSSQDAAIGVSSGATGQFSNLIELSGLLGASPLSTSASLFSADAGYTVANVFNLPTLTVTGDYFNFANFAMSGAGFGVIGAGSSSIPTAPIIFKATASSGGQADLLASANGTSGVDGFETLDSSSNNILFAGVAEASNTATNFGQTTGNFVKVVAAGSSNVGMLLGTTTNEPLIIGTNNAAVLTISGAGLSTFSGHLVVEGVTSTGATGTGKFVFATSPVLTTPNIGAATAASINFGGATLSAYNASTWTPTITTDGATGTPTYTTQVGSYEQIGRLVVARFTLVVATWPGSPTGNALIGGLPVTSNNTSGDSGSCVISNFITSTSFSWVTAQVLQNTTNVTLKATAAGGATSASQITAAQAGATAAFVGACIYHS